MAAKPVLRTAGRRFLTRAFLALLALGCAKLDPPDALAATLPAGRAAREERQASRLQSADDDKKKRVPKPPPPPEKERRKEDQSRDEDEESDSTPCFFDCLFGLLSSGSEEPASAIAPVLPGPRFPLRVGDIGIIVLLGDGYDDVELWSGPGGASEGYTRVGALEPGVRVRVLESHTMMGGEWLRIAPEDGAEDLGWIVARAVAAPPPPPPAPPPPPSPRGPRLASERHQGERPLMALLANVGAGLLVAPRDVRDEYSDPLFQSGLALSREVASGLHLGVAIGYGTGRGYPKFNYESSTRRDIPLGSRVHVAHVGMRIGQYTPVLAGNTRWYWALGPTVAWLRERATMDYQDLVSDSVVATGSRVETLTRVRPGGEAVTGMLWWIGHDDFLGIQLRASFVAWKSKERKSLTFDFIGDRTPVGIELGLLYAHDWF
jgi:hypothetical protein